MAGTALLADADIRGQVDVLVAACRVAWGGLWDALDVRVLTFGDLNLRPSAPDDEVWEACQRAGAVLITGNRNAGGPHSLEATIRSRGNATHLPVLTLANRERLARDRLYAERVATRLLELLMDIEKMRGSGRLYLP